MKKCLSCGGELENGCLMDYTYGSLLVQRYAKADVPQTNKKFGFMHETGFKDVRRTLAYRCTKCNRIEIYAQDLVLAQNLNKRNYKTLIIIIGISLLISMVIFILAISIR